MTVQGADPTTSRGLLLYEFFDGGVGRGLGAYHQTGWTALVAELIAAHRR